MSGLPTRCYLARCERRQQENPPVVRLDYASGEKRLCLKCWNEWIDSPEFQSGCGIPSDPSALERWVATVGGWR